MHFLRNNCNQRNFIIAINHEPHLYESQKYQVGFRFICHGNDTHDLYFVDGVDVIILSG